jgi:hypothetical protein
MAPCKEEFVQVRFDDPVPKYQRAYTYRTNGLELHVGDRVIVPVQYSGEKEATVVQLGSDYEGPTSAVSRKVTRFTSPSSFTVVEKDEYLRMSVQISEQANEISRLKNWAAQKDRMIDGLEKAAKLQNETIKNLSNKLAANTAVGWEEHVAFARDHLTALEAYLRDQEQELNDAYEAL